MLLAARSYILALLVCVLGVLGQWSAAVDENLWRLPAAALLVALVLEGFMARSRDIRVERALPARGFLGVPLGSELRVRNLSPYALFMDSVESLPVALDAPYETLHWRVPPGGTASRRVRVVPRELGAHAWQTVRTRSLGPLRLAWWHRKLALPAELGVVPNSLSAEEHRAGTTDQGRYARPLTGSGTELMGFRDYRPGDPMRSIDWKATARRGKPVIRLYATEEHVELVLAVDAGRTSGIQSGTLSRLGHYANVAARLAEKSLANGDHVSLVVFADEPLQVLAGLRGGNGLKRIRATLASMRTQARESNPLAAALRIRRLVGQRSLVVMFTDLDEGEIAGQLRRAASFLAPKHMPVVASLMDEDVLAMRWRRAERWIDPYRMLAALEIVKGARRTALHLERTGAHVVLARPAELDRRVLAAYEDLRLRRRV